MFSCDTESESALDDSVVNDNEHDERTPCVFSLNDFLVVVQQHFAKFLTGLGG